MSYDGHYNHAVRRLQLEMTGYWFTIVNRPDHMLEDANYFSRLNTNQHIDPLLKGYLEYARKLYTNNTPDTNEITPDNMPGRRKKRTGQEISPEQTSPCALAQIDFSNSPIDISINVNDYT